MFKKSLILSLTALGLAGCSTTPSYERYAKYKISDNDIKQGIAQFKSAFNCIYPEAINKSSQEIYNLVSRKMSEAEGRAWGVFRGGLFYQIIGQRDTDLMYQDENSKRYMNNKWFSLYDSVNPENQDYFKCGQKEKQEFQTNFVKREEEYLAKRKKEQELQQKAAAAKAEKERQEQEAFYKTPEGRKVKAMEELAAAQRATAAAQQQAAYAQQEAAYAQQKAIKDAKDRAYWDSINQQIQNNRIRYTNCYGNAYGNSVNCYSY